MFVHKIRISSFLLTQASDTLFLFIYIVFFFFKISVYLSVANTCLEQFFKTDVWMYDRSKKATSRFKKKIQKLQKYTSLYTLKL